MNHYLLKYSLIFLLLLSTASSMCLGAIQMTTKMTKQVPNIEQWIQKHFAKGKTPPFSFVCDGKSSNDFIRNWIYSEKQIPRKEADKIEYLYTYYNPANKMKVECTVIGYPRFHAVEWVMHFTNTGTQNSPIIEQVKVIDLAMQYRAKGDFDLHYSEGNHITKDDFCPHSIKLDVGKEKKMFSEGGRSSQGDYLPFFNIESASNKQGIILSIGWTGNWTANLLAKDQNTISMTSGMKTMRLYLQPKESIRTPSISLLFWEGDNRISGHNKFRRFVLAHKSRKIDGKFAEYPLSSGFNYHDPQPCQEYSSLTSNYAIAMVKRYIQFNLKPEVFWLDAGWNTDASDYEHGKSWANTVGNWTVDSLRFPKGLKQIADVIHKNGSKFMVWFEPERVIRGTQWAVEHPDWMLDIPKHDNKTYLLFDLGNPDACNWVCKYIGDMLEENNIDYYRQDFNMEPDVYWAANDEPGRIGMREIRHIEGLYKFWDYLLSRFPKLLIDNCASGGRRIDWETIGRSAPLWRSDYYHYYDTDGLQCQAYGLNYFLPLHGTGTVQTDPYSFRSSLSTALIYNWKITTKSSSITEMQGCLKEYKEVRPYYYEDYYPLTGIEDITRKDIWLAYQFHRPSDDSGIILAFRRSESKTNEILVNITSVKDNQKYLLTNLDTKESQIVLGKELIKGLKLILEKPRTSLLLKYQKLIPSKE